MRYSKKREDFLSRHSFKMVNEAPVNRGYIHLAGIDDGERIVNFIELPTRDGAYVAALYTAPPTQHSTKFEEDLIAFVLHELGCAVRSMVRRENGSAASKLHDETVKHISRSYSRR